MMSPENERIAVRFLVAALGQGREQARAWCRRLPESIHPALMAAAQAWFQKSCMEASNQFTALMGTSANRPLELAPEVLSTGRKKRTVWTPEMKQRQSRLVKRRMRAKGLLPAHGSKRKSTVEPQTVASDAKKS